MPNNTTKLPDIYQSVRQRTENICAPLAIEDYIIQPIVEVSPPKWHLAHTTWFFETFLLKAFCRDYKDFHPQYAELFNSYYYTLGDMHPRPERGDLSRPTVEEIYHYRRVIDQQMLRLLNDINKTTDPQLVDRVVLGLQHEQQHQELLLTDIKYILGKNPLRPAYQTLPIPPQVKQVTPEWIEIEGGIYGIGFDGSGFAFDNEGPRHDQLLSPFSICSHLVTNGDYMAFLDDDGYQRVELWLSDAWRLLQESARIKDWQAPLYWEKVDGQWWHMTLGGMRKVDPNAPVSHLSYFEADAYARWTGKRLPTEAEWEVFAQQRPIIGNFYEQGWLTPIASNSPQIYGDVWEWTQSPYSAYPGYRALDGALGEYNGKFMCNQMVLRGGSCATPFDHIRPSYRNFFYPQDRWQFTGLRLAESLT